MQLVFLMYGKRSISWLPRGCSHEFLEPSAPRWEKSIDVSFISISCSVHELLKLEGVSNELAHSIVITIYSSCQSLAYVSNSFTYLPIICSTIYIYASELCLCGTEALCIVSMPFSMAWEHTFEFIKFKGMCVVESFVLVVVYSGGTWPAVYCTTPLWKVIRQQYIWQLTISKLKLAVSHISANFTFQRLY